MKTVQSNMKLNPASKLVGDPYVAHRLSPGMKVMAICWVALVAGCVSKDSASDMSLRDAPMIFDNSSHWSDMSPGSCTIRCSNCACQATCDYKNYHLSCSSSDGGVCGCYEETKPIKVAPAASCANKSSMLDAYKTTCGFPGAHSGTRDGSVFSVIDARPDCEPSCGGGGSYCNCKMNCKGGGYFIECKSGTCTCTRDGKTIGTSTKVDCNDRLQQVSAAKKSCGV